MRLDHKDITTMLVVYAHVPTHQQQDGAGSS
jgi:hypothetical protein